MIVAIYQPNGGKEAITLKTVEANFKNSKLSFSNNVTLDVVDTVPKGHNGIVVEVDDFIPYMGDFLDMGGYTVIAEDISRVLKDGLWFSVDLKPRLVTKKDHFPLLTSIFSKTKRMKT